MDEAAAAVQPYQPSTIVPFVEWLESEDGGFWVKEWWDAEAEVMRSGGGYLHLEEHQRRILGHALYLTPAGRFPYTTLLYSATKKSGKTAIGAAIGVWYALQFAGSEVYVIANDLDQAQQRVFADITYHVEHEIDGANVTKQRIELPNGSAILAVAKEYKSAAGSRHSLTIWDELWGYVSEQSQRMWAELTPIPTVPHSLRVVVTYAGFENESNLLWELYKRGVGPEEHEKGKGQDIDGFADLPVWANKRLLTYWDHEHRMPWQTVEYYDEEAENLRPSDFLRLHHNQWVSGHETFIPLEWWTSAARKYAQSAEIWEEHPYRRWRIFVAVDVAPKHDCSSVVGVAYDERRGKVVLVFHRIWTPQGQEFDLESTVEAYLIDKMRRFSLGSVEYDPYQFHRSMMTLRHKHAMPMREFTQTQDHMIAATQQLYDLMRYGNLEAYPDDEAGQHIKNAVAQNTPRGFRIVKDPFIKKGSKELVTRKPIDFTVALAMACYAAVKLGAVQTDTAARIESPFADVSGWKPVDEEATVLPWMFRS